MRKIAGCIALLVIIAGCGGHGTIEPDDKLCVGGLPPVAQKNKNIQGELSLLAGQIFEGGVNVEYESTFTKLLGDDALREWVVAETECRVARESSENTHQKRWFLVMQTVARTSPTDLFSWLRENPMPNLSGHTEQTEVPEGQCAWQVITSFSDGRTETRRVGTWTPSGQMMKIPNAMLRDYLKHMRCEEKN